MLIVSYKFWDTCFVPLWFIYRLMRYTVTMRLQLTDKGNAMEQWEYLTVFLEASAKKKEVRDFIKNTFNKKAKLHSPESMIPNLNEYGRQGWELVHMEPVPRVGGKEDVQFDQYSWSNTYFCVFKRREPGTSVPVHVAQSPQAQQPQPQQPAKATTPPTES
jgi:hypothetical protein